MTTSYVAFGLQKCKVASAESVPANSGKSQKTGKDWTDPAHIKMVLEDFRVAEVSDRGNQPMVYPRPTTLRCNDLSKFPLLTNGAEVMVGAVAVQKFGETEWLALVVEPVPGAPSPAPAKKPTGNTI